MYISANFQVQGELGRPTSDTDQELSNQNQKHV